MQKIYSLKIDNLKKEQDKKLFYKDKNEKIDLITYFNSFSIYKWKKYTTLKKLYLNLQCKEKIEIEIVGITNQNEELILKKLENEKLKKIEIPIDNNNLKIIGIKIQKLDKNKIEEISYYGEFEREKRKKISFVICTYKREEYLKKNIPILKKIISNFEKDVDLIIIDNGQTLIEEKEDNFEIKRNLNTGGAGGFSYGIIKKLEKSDYISLMDDDIEFTTETIERLISFINNLKSEYESYFIGSSMLDMDKRNIQIEKNASWNYFFTKIYGKNLDLTKRKNLIENEKEKREKGMYSGWWFCTIPKKSIKEIGLPLPIFIKGDDLEYSLRNNSKIINMNGLGVWHEHFKAKYNPTTYYYWLRNTLILNSIHCGKKTNFLLYVSLKYMMMLLKYDRNKNEKFYLAILDFMVGLDKLLEISPDLKHKIIIEKNINKSFYSLNIEILKNIIRIYREYYLIVEKNKNFKIKLKDVGEYERIIKI